MNIDNYSNRLCVTVTAVSFSCPDNTPYHILATEIVQMIQSYLDDSDFFLKKKDFVNQYASLGYAHGWLHAGSYLGLYCISDVEILYEDITLPDEYDVRHLQEKTSRYFSMLTLALESVASFPSKGSPLSPASENCLSVAKNSLDKGEFLQKHALLVPALGYLCYGYGWLDTAVRAGLLSIKTRPDLFTTEC